VAPDSIALISIAWLPKPVSKTMGRSIFKAGGFFQQVQPRFSAEEIIDKI
jgi:hypothetical protein